MKNSYGMISLFFFDWLLNNLFMYEVINRSHAELLIAVYVGEKVKIMNGFTLTVSSLKLLCYCCSLTFDLVDFLMN